MIIQNPLLKHWVQRHKLPINVENFQEDLYVHGSAPADSGSEDSEDREDEIPPCVLLQDSIVASADTLEQGNLITLEKVGRTVGDNFVVRAKRQKGSDNVANPTSSSP